MVHAATSATLGSCAEIMVGIDTCAPHCSLVWALGTCETHSQPWRDAMQTVSAVSDLIYASKKLNS